MWRAAAAVSLDAAAIGAQRAVVGDQRLQRLAGGDVDHLAGDLVATATWISLSPYMSSVKVLPEASATVPRSR